MLHRRTSQMIQRLHPHYLHKTTLLTSVLALSLHIHTSVQALDTPKTEGDPTTDHSSLHRSTMPESFGEFTVAGSRVFPDPTLGYMVRYGAPPSSKADVFVYSAGFTQIPVGITSPEVITHFQKCVDEITSLKTSGHFTALDVIQTRNRYIGRGTYILPVKECVFRIAVKRQQGNLSTDNRISHLLLTSIGGRFLKLRFSYLEAERSQAYGKVRAFIDDFGAYFAKAITDGAAVEALTEASSTEQNRPFIVLTADVFHDPRHRFRFSNEVLHLIYSDWRVLEERTPSKKIPEDIDGMTDASDIIQAFRLAADGSTPTSTVFRDVVAALCRSGRLTLALDVSIHIAREECVRRPDDCQIYLDTCRDVCRLLFDSLCWHEGHLTNSDPRDFADLAGLKIGHPQKYGMTTVAEDRATYKAICDCSSRFPSLYVGVTGTEAQFAKAYGYSSIEEYRREFNLQRYIREQLALGNVEPALKALYFWHLDEGFTLDTKDSSLTQFVTIDEISAAAENARRVSSTTITVMKAFQTATSFITSLKNHSLAP